MLVLGRKRNERIIVGDGLVVITVCDVGDGKVRIGVDAPKEMSVMREELITDERVRSRINAGVAALAAGRTGASGAIPPGPAD